MTFHLLQGNNENVTQMFQWPLVSGASCSATSTVPRRTAATHLTLPSGSYAPMTNMLSRYHSMSSTAM